MLRPNKVREDELRSLLVQGRRHEAEALIKHEEKGSVVSKKRYLDTLLKTRRL